MYPDNDNSDSALRCVRTYHRRGYSSMGRSRVLGLCAVVLYHDCHHNPSKLEPNQPQKSTTERQPLICVGPLREKKKMKKNEKKTPHEKAKHKYALAHNYPDNHV